MNSELYGKDQSKLFYDDAEQITEYCKKYCNEEADHILLVADDVCRGSFLFDLRWDMERTYQAVTFKDRICWDYMPANDPEFVWQFNRHRYFICLGQAYQMTKDEKYTKCFLHLITDWIDACKLTDKTRYTMWRSLEVGLRGEYWTKALQYFRESKLMTEEMEKKIAKSLIMHAEYLMDTYDPYRYLSNWGVLETHGLFDIAVFLPESDRTKEYITTALKRLEILAATGIMNDGVWWEQSPMYHNEVLQCFLDVLILSKKNHIAISQKLSDRIHQMVLADVAWTKPDHHQYMMGDSDDTDIRDIFTKAAYLFHDPVLKFCGFAQFDYETIWDLGIAAANEYKELDVWQPDFISAQLADSGNYYLRSDWSETADLLHFHCGTIGAGHGHSDQLHVDVTFYGEDVLTDAGRYTYVVGPERYEFKDPAAHNTCTVDDKLFTICKNSWECSKLSQPVKQIFRTTQDYDLVVGGHLGYMDLDHAVFVNRKVIYIKPDMYLLFDEFYTDGTHSYQQYFHFNENGKVSVDGRTVTYEGERADAHLHFLTPEINIELSSSRISRHYNQAVKNACIRTSFHNTGFASAITVIYGGRKGCQETIDLETIPVYSALKGIEYQSSMAEAVRIKNHGQVYVVIVCHQEVNSPTDLVLADGCYGYGNVIVFNKNESNITGNVLLF